MYEFFTLHYLTYFERLSFISISCFLLLNHKSKSTISCDLFESDFEVTVIPSVRT
jgi:hypothetical protein